MDWETALITKVIEERDIRTVIKQKIDSTFFYGTVSKAAFQWLLEWYRNPVYGDTPSWEMFSATFEGFEGTECADSLVSVCEKVRERKLYSDLSETLRHVADATMADTLEGFEELKRQVSRLAVAHTVNNVTSVNDHILSIRSEYNRVKHSAVKLRGLPYPWPKLNEATLGAMGGNLIIGYGRPKSLKTWLFLEVIKGWNDKGARVCVFSQELSDAEIARRYVALVCGVDYRKFCRGELEPEVERDFFENLEMFAERPPFDIDYLEGFGDEVGIELKAKVDEMGYTAIMIDGGHVIGRDWKEIGLMTKAVKRVLKEKDIPGLITTHANRTKKAEVGGGGDDVAHSDAFFQDCDLALRILREAEQRRAREVLMWTAAVREGDSCAFTVHTELAGNLTQKEEVKVGEDEEGEAELDGAADERVATQVKALAARAAERRAEVQQKKATKLRLKR